MRVMGGGYIEGPMIPKNRRGNLGGNREEIVNCDLVEGGMGVVVGGGGTYRIG